VSTPAIEVLDVSKRFELRGDRRTRLKERFVRGRASTPPREFWALRNATFSVPKGSSLGLIGHNGSGKSTALKVLTGIYRPTSGTVRVHGTVSALLEVGAGFHPELSGRENIRLNATILGFSKREIDRMMDSIIEFADIGEHIDAPIKHYSSGMHVRLGFAVAVMVRPEILLVDEVIAVGDEEFQRRCYEHLYELRRAGTSMILVSHGMGNIVDLCDEAVWLSKGEVQQIGPSRAVIASYIASVNEKEAARQAAERARAAQRAATPWHTKDGRARRGSGELRVESVEIVTGDEATGGAAVTGEPVTFRLHYVADRDIPRAVFGLGFRHHSGVVTAGPNSGATGGWAIPAGTGVVEFHVDVLTLQPGEFSVTSAVVDQGHTYDEAEEQALLRVRSAGEVEPGLVRLYGEWSHHADSEHALSEATG
jgi:homopolymeric O-antigen transport system ATP-binding protein